MPKLDIFGGFDPSPNQLDICADDHTLFVVAGNRGSRKTTAVSWKTMDIFSNFETEGFIGRFHRKYLYETTLSLWKQLFPPKEWQHIYEFGGGKSAEEPDYMKFASGSICHLIPLSDIDRVRGGNFGLFFIDQLEECKQKVWNDSVKVLRGPVWQTINQGGKIIKRDVGAQMRRGLATINKNRGWYWIRRLFIDKVDFNRKPIAAHIAARMRIKELPHDENKKFWSEGYYDNIIANAQSQAEIDFEVYGKDPSEFGLVFPELDREPHTKRFEFSDPELRDASFYLGYDEGFDVPSAFVFMAVTPDGTHWVRAEHYMAGWNVAQHAEKLKEIAKRIGFPLHRDTCRMVADPAIGGKGKGYGIGLDDQWKPHGFFWNMGSKKEGSGLEIMRTLMMPDADRKVRFIVHPDDCPEVWEDMSDAYYDEDKPGKILKRCRMHGCDSVRYVCLEARKPHHFQPPPNLNGTWKQLLAMKPGEGWLAPSDHSKLWMVP